MIFSFVFWVGFATKTNQIVKTLRKVPEWFPETALQGQFPKGGDVSFV
jgi:hypothetical protein